MDHYLYLKEEELGLYIRIENLRELMQREGIKTQTELAGRIGLTVTSLNRLVKRRRKGMDSTTIDKLCRELNAQPGDFLYYEPDPAE